MLNKIWFWLLFLGILYGFGRGVYQSSRDRLAGTPTAVGANRSSVPPKATAADTADVRGVLAMGKALNDAALDAAKLSVEVCIGLIGIMALWLGLMRIAEESGLVDFIARGLQPIMRWLFPEVPHGHPAQGAIVMNLAANMLGLDNAATPLGLKAMRELQTLNPSRDTATNSMATFLALNTSSVTLIPFTILAYRKLAGSQNPVGPLAGMILATAVSTLVAILAVRLLARLPGYAVSNPLLSQGENELRQA